MSWVIFLGKLLSFFSLIILKPSFKA